jgi:hypothetical protein
MGELQSRLDAADRTAVINDVVALIDGEVQNKSGLSGVALKGGYSVVKRLKGGRMIHEAADALLDPFAEALEPLYAEYLADPDAKTFEAFLSGRRSEAAQALLGITDAKVKRAEKKVIIKTYAKLRGQAEKHVLEAIPGTGRLIDKYAPKDESN